ncbi:MAG TPA: hypothetical protein VF599_21755 [Pyrinomonadaceae bacterium]|jgi:hypothetical protein
MIEAQIQIDDELAVKGYRKALRYKAAKDIAYFYASKLMIVWVVIAVADALFGAEHLIKPHFFFLLALGAAASVYSYRDWNKKISELKGWSFSARLDEMGVATTSPQESWYEWSSYAGYREFDDYLEIERLPGEISFLPKTPELFQVIEFTKEKIPAKK